MGDAGDSRYFAGKGQAEIQGSGVENEYRSGRNANMMDSKFTSELELPPRHWMCIVCKKVSLLLQSISKELVAFRYRGVACIQCGFVYLFQHAGQIKSFSG